MADSNCNYGEQILSTCIFGQTFCFYTFPVTETATGTSRVGSLLDHSKEIMLGILFDYNLTLLQLSLFFFVHTNIAFCIITLCSLYTLFGCDRLFLLGLPRIIELFLYPLLSFLLLYQICWLETNHLQALTSLGLSLFL